MDVIWRSYMLITVLAYGILCDEFEMPTIHFSPQVLNSLYFNGALSKLLSGSFAGMKYE